MTKRDDFLVEILVEELPPKSLYQMAQQFCQDIGKRLQKEALDFADIHFYATPRRLAVYVSNLIDKQADQEIEKKGPALKAAFDKEGKPTPACIGFANSAGVKPEALMTIKSAQGEWVGIKQKVAGKTVQEILPTLILEALNNLPAPKRMRWGNNEFQFIRPIHSIILLYGKNIIPATLFGIETNRTTYGHRFHAPKQLSIPHPNQYLTILESKGFVIADFMRRKETIRQQALTVVKQKLGDKAELIISSDAFLNEVTGLSEWPNAVLGSFDQPFLKVPKEVLISSMQDHQRYFPVADHQGALLPHFVTIANIASKNPERLIHGNERVLRARLADAAFFYQTDQTQTLSARLDTLKGIVFQAKLGSLYDKSQRISQLAGYIAELIKVDATQAKRAGLLAKCDLTSNMVNEFPELQGTMGAYYAQHDKEPEAIAKAIGEQYLPRFAGDRLPATAMGQALALADRVDTLVGYFGVNLIPTGDKDPFGLRRAALGVIRIIIENKLSLDLHALLQKAFAHYPQLANPNASMEVLTFINERLRVWYLDNEITADIFAAVSALGIVDLLDAHSRLLAVKKFKTHTAAESLASANKRVSNLLAKTELAISGTINTSLFEHAAENALAKEIEKNATAIQQLCQQKRYGEALIQLAELRSPVDNFFDHVMVMTDDPAKRDNRLLMLSKLRGLFLQVADIALLQS